MPKCSNANIGTFNHECGKPAAYAGARSDGDIQLFCEHCRAEGDEARGVVAWMRLLPVCFDQAPIDSRAVAYGGVGCGPVQIFAQFETANEALVQQACALAAKHGAPDQLALVSVSRDGATLFVSFGVVAS